MENNVIQNNNLKKHLVEKGRKLLMGELPYSDDKFTTPAISRTSLKEYLSVYKMDLDSDLDKISFPKEVSFYNGRTVLDQVVNNGVTRNKRMEEKRIRC